MAAAMFAETSKNQQRDLFLNASETPAVETKGQFFGKEAWDFR